MSLSIIKTGLGRVKARPYKSFGAGNILHIRHYHSDAKFVNSAGFKYHN